MTDSILLIAVIAGGTMLLRFLPFWIFGERRKTPPIVTYLGSVLPWASMGMLVIYCLKDVTFSSFPFGIPEILCCLVTALLHIWKRNTLLSILGGTVLYMVLVQVVF